MKYEQFAPQELLEVAMSPGALDDFVASGDAAGIRAGFEAELCFTGKGGGEGGRDYDADPEPDWGPDTRARDINTVCDFFHDGDMNGRRDIERLRVEMTDAYHEWLDEQLGERWEEQHAAAIREYVIENNRKVPWIKKYLRDELDMSPEQIEATFMAIDDDGPSAEYMEARDAWASAINDMVEEAIEEKNSLWDSAREIWEEEQREELDDGEWLTATGIYYMSEVINEFNDVSWPYWEYPEREDEDGWNDRGAEAVASSLRDSMGVTVEVGGGYHMASRAPGKWIIEPDGSLNADSGDMPAEIVSPPYPLQECLDKMRQFFEWAKGEDAYSNGSTGLHVGVSLPVVDGRVDFVKLALFLGDKHVLGQFGRESNHYTESAISKLERVIFGMQPDQIENVLKLMRSGLYELASGAINSSGFGKYTSINLKGSYIEFRSMGNNYMDQIDEVINNVKRYAYAMWIASRPDLYREEYAKKLYDLISGNRRGGGKDDITKLFARYATKNITKEELKSELRQRSTLRDMKRGLSGNYRWNVYRWGKNDPRSADTAVQVHAATEEAALEKARIAWGYPSMDYIEDAEAEVIGRSPM